MAQLLNMKSLQKAVSDIKKKVETQVSKQIFTSKCQTCGSN